MLSIGPKLFTCLLLQLCVVQASEPAEASEPVEDAGDKEEEVEDLTKVANVRRAGELLADWFQSDHIEVYYGEFLLAQWVLDKSPWNAYHSGMAFVDNRSNRKCLYDYSPADVSSVMNMVMPQISANESSMVYLGDFDLEWRDASRTQLDMKWPANYEKFVRLGVLNGTVFRAFTEWVADDFAPRHHSFQPLEVVVVDAEKVKEANSRWGPVRVRSTMCHDFVTDSLWILHEHGVKLRAEGQVFRDHIIMYATDAEDASELAQTWTGKRKWLRYLRQLYMSLDKIRKEFTHAREALIWNWKLHLPVFLHTAQRPYQVKLAPPFLNYCYLPLAIPPKVHNPLADLKLCALGLVANTTNSSAPWPWGTLLAAEERLDRPEVIMALLLSAFVAALVASDYASPPPVSSQEKTD